MPDFISFYVKMVLFIIQTVNKFLPLTVFITISIYRTRGCLSHKLSLLIKMVSVSSTKIKSVAKQNICLTQKMFTSHDSADKKDARRSRDSTDNQRDHMTLGN